MNKKYKPIIFLGLLRNPSIKDSFKERILRSADDSWSWLPALGETQMPESCIELVAELIDDQLSNAIKIGISKKDPKRSQFHIDDKVFGAIRKLFQQPRVSMNFVKPILEKLEKNDLWWSYYKPIVNSVLENAKKPDDIICFMASSKNKYFVKAIAAHPETPKKYLEILSKSSDTEVLSQLARNAADTKTLLFLLEQDQDESIVESLADNPNLPEDIVLRIVESNNWGGKLRIAERDDISIKVIDILSSDEDEYIRRKIAQRKALPQNVILRLSCDPDESIRIEIAKRADLPQELIAKFFMSRSLEIDLSLAANPAITDEMCDTFAQSKDKELLSKLFVNPKISKVQLDRMSKEKDKSWVATWIFGLETLSPEAAAIFARCKNSEIREKVASFQNLPSEVLELLASDKNPEVRTAVAMNIHCTKKILKEIISNHTDEGDFHLPLWIAQNANTTDILELMLDRIMVVHQESITLYKQQRANDPHAAVIVPRDFRSLKLFYANPLASDQIKITAASIYSSLAEADEGLRFVDQIVNKTITSKKAFQVLLEKILTPDNELFLSGLVTSPHLSEDVIDFLIEKLL